MTSYPLEALLPVIEALERLRVPYCVGGSLASSLYGVGRTTLDADLVADLDPRHVPPLVAALQAAYYVDAGMILDAIARRSCFNVIHLASMFKVDVFVLKDRSYDRTAFARIRRDTLTPDGPGAEVFLASPEDVVLNKLEWFRLGDEISERQWRDAVGVLKVQKDRLDRSYLARWGSELGLTDLLQRAWKEAEE
jgi:hypothetical protein